MHIGQPHAADDLRHKQLGAGGKHIAVDDVKLFHHALIGYLIGQIVKSLGCR